MITQGHNQQSTDVENSIVSLTNKFQEKQTKKEENLYSLKESYEKKQCLEMVLK